MRALRRFVPAAAELVREAVRDARKSRGAFLLGCGAVFLVVLVAAVVSTVVEKAPLVFLREAEVGSGQRDLLLTAAASTPYATLNYSQLSAALAASAQPDRFSYHAPRVLVQGATLYRADACAGPEAGADAADDDGYGSSDADAAGPNAEGIVLSDDDSSGTGGAGGNSWMYRMPSGRACGWSMRYGFVSSCLFRRCAHAPRAQGATLLLLDSAREARMGLGRKPQQWESQTGGGGTAIPPGRLVLHAQLARDAGGLQADDVVLVTFSSGALLRRAFAPLNAASTGWEARASIFAEVAVPYVVHAVVTSFVGKLGGGDGRGFAMAELGSFMDHVAENLHPALQDAFRDSSLPQAAGFPLPLPRVYEFATEISVNLPPAQRVQAYTSPNVDVIRGALADFASALIYVVGFPELDALFPLLPLLELRRFVGIYLGVLLQVLLVVLFTLSAVLIYSLLLINVSSRTFEIAVRRMLGSGRPVIVALLLLQAATYSVPALAIGLLVAQAIAAGVLSNFSTVSGFAVSVALTPAALLTSLALATAIPSVAAVGPIRVALGPSIREALDTERPKATLVKLSIERSDEGAVPWVILVCGFGMFLFGGAIYYALPLALVSLNLTLLASVFVGVLLGLLTGLVLLALNVELMAQRLVAFVCVAWWESAAVLKLTLGNLVAHRLRNRKTFLMYCLSVSFVVLITVAAEQQVRSATYGQQQRSGAAVVVSAPTSGGGFDPAVAAALDTVVSRYSFVGASGWASVRISDALTASLAAVAAEAPPVPPGSPGPLYQASVFLVNLGRVVAWTSFPQAVSPSIFGGATFASFNIESSADVAPTSETALSPSEQLYTARGGQGFIASSMLRIELALRRGAQVVLETTAERSSDGVAAAASGGGANPLGTYFTRSRLVSVGAMEHASHFLFSRTPNWNVGGTLFSFPTFARLVDLHVTAGGAQRVDSELVFSSWRRMLAASPGGSTPAAALELLLSAAGPAGDAATARHLVAGLGLEDLQLQTLFVNFDAINTAGPSVDALVADLRDAVVGTLAARVGQAPQGADLAGYTLYDMRDGGEDEAATVAVLNLVFSVLTLVALALCFFGLFASMGANILEQKREAGVLLALGLPPHHLVRVYAHEAFVLVVAACGLGVIIGTVVAFSFGLQQQLFTGIPVPAVVPWATSGLVLLTSVAAAWASSAVPAAAMAKRPITALLR